MPSGRPLSSVGRLPITMSNDWTYDLGFNIAGSVGSRMRTFAWKKMLWFLRVTRAVEMKKRWKRNPPLVGKGVWWGTRFMRPMSGG